MTLRDDSDVRAWCGALEAASHPAAVKAIPALGSFDNWTYGYSPGGSHVNYGLLAGDITRNGTVAICLRWLQVNALSGPKLCVGLMDDDNGRYDENPDHEMSEDIRRPNPFQAYTTLLGCTVKDIAYPGYAYWIKGTGPVGNREYYWVPTWTIEPRPDDAGVRVVGYHYRPPGSGQQIWLRPEQVVHFRFGSDPWAMWQGLSPLAAQYRSIVALNNGESWTASALGNGHRGTLISPDEDSGGAGFDEALINAIRRKIFEQTGGAGAGGIAGVPQPIRALPIGFSPEEALIDTILDRPEGMVLAALGLNALVTGLPSSAETRTYSNLGEAKVHAAEYGLKPLLAIVAETLQTFALPDYEGQEPQSEVWWDYSEYTPLQEDANARANRASMLFEGGIARLNEARELAGLNLLEETDPRGEMFKSEIGMEQAREMAALTAPDEERAETREGEGEGPRALDAPEDESESEAANAA